ncbi:MAG: FHA domain-containing protein [Planctomycetota bacterium]
MDTQEASDGPEFLPVGGQEPIELEFMTGRRSGEVLRFEESEVLIGRRSRNHVVLDGPEEQIVSGYHAKLTRIEGAWWIEDRGSTNGTRLNGQPLLKAQARPLDDRDIIEFGRPAEGNSTSTVRMRVGVRSPSASMSDGASGVELTIPAAEPMSPVDLGSALDHQLDVAAEHGTHSSHEWESSDAHRDATAITDAGASVDAASPGAPVSEATDGRPVSSTSPTLSPEALRDFHEKSMQLGQIEGRLGAVLRDLEGACLDGSLDLSSIDQGRELVELQAQRDQNERTVGELAARIQELQNRSERETSPLVDALESATTKADSLLEDETRSKATANELEKEYQTLHTGLRDSIQATVADVFREESKQAGTDVAEPWVAWEKGLLEALELTRARSTELEDASRALERGRAECSAAADASRAAAQVVRDAKDSLESRRGEFERLIKEAESESMVTRRSLDALAGRISSLVDAVLRTQLADPSSPLLTVPRFAEAAELSSQKESIRAALAEIHPDLFAPSSKEK